MPASRWITATIASGAAVTGPLELKPGERILGILTPSAWTAADIYLQVSFDNSTYTDVSDSAGAALKLGTSIATAAEEFRVTSNVVVAGATQGVRDVPFANHVRLRSVNTASEADVNQGAARTIRVMVG